MVAPVIARFAEGFESHDFKRAEHAAQNRRFAAEPTVCGCVEKAASSAVELAGITP